MTTTADAKAAAGDDLAFDTAYLLSRAADCRLTAGDLAELTGIPATDLDRHLRPDTISAARLIHLAHALDARPETLLHGAARHDPATAAHADDTTVLHAALHTAGRVHPADLATALDWPPDRLRAAATALCDRLDRPESPHRLVFTDTLAHLAATPGLLTPQQRTSLETAGRSDAALAPDEAALAARLLHHHQAGTLAPTIRATDIPRLAERRLLAPTIPATPHRDLLFALGIAETP
jgi:hypothetical protein